MTRRGQPDPDAEKPICRRLENVRQSTGLDLKSFHARLVEEEGLETTYHAARRWHYDRPPPVDYVAKVAKVYDVNLEWLATGAGDPGDVRVSPRGEIEAVTRREWVRKGLSEGFFEDPDHEIADRIKLDVLTDVWVRAAIRTLSTVQYEGPEEYELARRVGEAAAAPLRAFAIDPTSVPPEDLRDYLETVVPAFVLASRARSIDSEEAS